MPFSLRLTSFFSPAFSGLLFSNIPSLNQVSLFLVVAVLFDTFVVRTFVLTGLFGLIGDALWWPARLTPLRQREAHSMSSTAIDNVESMRLNEELFDKEDEQEILR
jgi:uncharacterized membrane protein YdfJ with MMPL/SSD domain